MSVKTTGSLFKKFYDDPSVWLDGYYHDDTVITVDGKLDEGDIDLAEVQDAAVVVVSSGWIINADGAAVVDFGAALKRWLKKQDTVSLVVECDASVLEAVKAAIKAAGGKAIS